MSNNNSNRRLFWPSRGDLVHAWTDYDNEVQRLREDGDTIAISIDGACSNNGYPNARASYGVHFGDHSSFNECGEVPYPYAQTNQSAELYAAKMALETIFAMIHNYDVYLVGGFERMLLISDSAYLVNGISSWVWAWERNGWRNYNGQRVVNRRLWQELHGMVQEIQLYGCEVCFFHVMRESNRDADALARSVLY